MKFLGPLIVALFLIQTATALIAAQTAGSADRQTAELEEHVQFTETGAAYKHGHWCMDSRVF